MINHTRPEFWVCSSPDYTVSLGLLSHMRNMAARTGAVVAAVVFSEDLRRDEIYQAGADKIYNIHYADYDEGIAQQLVVLCREFCPQIVIFPATVVMRSVAAMAAAMLRCGLCADCTALDLDKNNMLIQTRPTFSDTLMADIITEKVRPQMATVRPGIYVPEFRDGAQRKEIPARDFEKDTNKLIKVIEEVSLNQNPLIDARVIVSAGQGIGPGGFMKLLQFAKLIGASVGASRGAVSAGYAPYTYQIGLTGITVRPDIYMAFGISGAIQHIVGMSNAGYVVAVNPDEKAPIFEYTDLAIFATWEETIDQMIHRFGSKKESTTSP